MNKELAELYGMETNPIRKGEQQLTDKQKKWIHFEKLVREKIFSGRITPGIEWKNWLEMIQWFGIYEDGVNYAPNRRTPIDRLLLKYFTYYTNGRKIIVSELIPYEQRITNAGEQFLEPSNSLKINAIAGVFSGMNKKNSEKLESSIAQSPERIEHRSSPIRGIYSFSISLMELFYELGMVNEQFKIDFRKSDTNDETREVLKELYRFNKDSIESFLASLQRKQILIYTPRVLLQIGNEWKLSSIEEAIAYRQFKLEAHTFIDQKSLTKKFSKEYFKEVKCRTLQIMREELGTDVNDYENAYHIAYSELLLKRYLSRADPQFKGKDCKMILENIIIEKVASSLLRDYRGIDLSSVREEVIRDTDEKTGNLVKFGRNVISEKDFPIEFRTVEELEDIRKAQIEKYVYTKVA